MNLKIPSDLNQIDEAVSKQNIISNMNSPSNSIDGRQKAKGNELEIENYIESTFDDDLTNNSRNSKIEQNLKFDDLKYIKKNSDGNFMSYFSEK